MRKFASVAITIVAVSLAAFIGIRAMQLNWVYELGPAISFEPQAPVQVQQSAPSEPVSPIPEKAGQP